VPTFVSLIRHGQTSWNAAGRWQGHAHVPLNDEGRKQAAQLGEYLAAQNGKIAPIEAIYSSDSSRAYETAQIIANCLGHSEVIADARLREIDMGEWQGMTKEEIRTWDSERYEQVMRDGFHIPRPGGESSGQVQARALLALESIVTNHPDSHVLVVTHGGTIRNILDGLGVWEGKPADIGNTSLTRLKHSFDLVQEENTVALWEIDLFNMQNHLVARANSTQEE
jgi:broad specificity phosphatase PhoE